MGPRAVGKTAILYELANRLACARVPDALKGKRIVQLSTTGLEAGAVNTGEPWPGADGRKHRGELHPRRLLRISPQASPWPRTGRGAGIRARGKTLCTH